ncbi:unnamed protein product [Polarella glacialis]|uniref:Tim44-like domain-containing protein n=1 Tax=Polarella glacialis TaxID=89957 RepID=A0A813GFX6_POLGL|nr:unnamed protein product [Polarella glacialis]CAE8661345.1 unnamed protein product [Polarella glacialis]
MSRLAPRLGCSSPSQYRVLSAPGAARSCSTGGAHPQKVLKRLGSMSGVLDLLTINVRHIVNSINLRTLNVVYPNCWDAREFRAGAAEAYTQINKLLDEGDFESLQGLLSEELLAELRASHAALAQGVNYELKDLRQLGIFKSTAKVDEFDDAAVFVTPLLRVTEKFTLSKDSSIWWEVRRLHKWTFKRTLAGEAGQENSDWQVVAMDKRRWRPDGIDDASE